MSEPVSFTRLFPPGGDQVDAQTYVNGLGLEREIPAHRPLVMANMVGTLDGNASFDGRSAPLSGPGDRQMFHALRGVADAIMAGTSTLKLEGYRPAGKPVVTVTHSGRLPVEIPLLAQPEGRVIAFSAEPPDLREVEADVSVEPLTDLAAAMATLRVTYGISTLLCEGGPGLLGSMIRAGLVDELFLTLSPTLAGGAAGSSLTSGDPAPELTPMTLGSILECQNMLFLRYLHS